MLLTLRIVYLSLSVKRLAGLTVLDPRGGRTGTTACNAQLCHSFMYQVVAWPLRAFQCLLFLLQVSVAVVVVFVVLSLCTYLCIFPPFLFFAISFFFYCSLSLLSRSRSLLSLPVARCCGQIQCCGV